MTETEYVEKNTPDGKVIKNKKSLDAEISTIKVNNSLAIVDITASGKEVVKGMEKNKKRAKQPTHLFSPGARTAMKTAISI
ncbi:hypothetical protein NRK67_03125 [Fusobacteria bacterium ZRK30]|nr:hypothetical protein NRK67_03125 [Fusobacteria bacterium ZRK30]